MFKRLVLSLALAVSVAVPATAAIGSTPASACNGICLLNGTLAGAITSASVVSTATTYQLTGAYTGAVLIEKSLVTSGTFTINAVGGNFHGIFVGTGTIHVQDSIGTIDTPVGITATPLLITFSSFNANDVATGFSHSVVGDVVLGAVPIAGVIKGVETVS